MKPPVMPPVEPMLAKSAAGVPVGEYLYEPKWDGYRCIVFRDGPQIELGSRGGKSLNRYFPELLTALAAALPPRCVVDGEIVVVADGRLDFDRLADRIHPAESRVRLLAQRTPASFIAFDVLALGDEDLTGWPFAHRREVLTGLLVDRKPRGDRQVHVTRATADAQVARGWFERFEGAGLDGIVAKPLDGKYTPGERTMIKVKHERTADVVVGGYRLHKSGPVVGSLMLGLYGADGVLNYVGGSSAFTMARRARLVEELKPLLLGAGQVHPWLGAAEDETHRRPGAPNRWNAGKDTSFVALRPESVCEVRYDQLQSGRFRHNAQFARWRPDRDAASCTYDQLEVPVPYDLGDVFE
ncbi:ATP-dependent DNA ligase [Actinocrinis puniceicyclus]|uniref:DNA ligase (ATP) n=1 Tax=Actinocrinis puniceicyclus TaxID=977794 RepID=A0A8J8BAP3_9ACTN|nr:ATP-dependent DNA ligase [Actinocrinis puniceicyclus]MBS2963172.1 ATP-dependent DNA ligase [Actinocrinis puniceicyclus]